MFQKVALGVLVLTLILAGTSGIYDAMQRSQANTPAVQSRLVVQTSAPQEPPQATAVANQGNGAQAKSGSAVGDPWTAKGTITGLDDTGMNLTLNDGGQIYVELGPSTYWKTQSVQLKVGDVVEIDGFAGGGQFHAGTVTLKDGGQLVVRSTDGKPLWAGASAKGQTGNQANGTQQAQVPADAWLTLNGTILTAGRSTLTVNTAEQGELTLSLGEAGFVQSQGVTFQQGDKVKIVGFWQGTRFQAGEIDNLTTGQRVMLRDPNGRPLWAGPGRSSVQSGQGNGGQGSGNGNGQGSGSGLGNGNGQGNGRGKGQSNGNQGNGNGRQNGGAQ
jgi:hypothetical protein